MKTRTLALVAGMVLVAASAGISQAAGLDKKADAPDILHSMDSASYKAVSKEEMAKIIGESYKVYYGTRLVYSNDSWFSGQHVVVRCNSAGQQCITTRTVTSILLPYSPVAR